MASATPTTVSVVFDPNAINLQSDIIFAASSTAAGVMTAEQFLFLEQLAGLVAGSFGPLIFTNIARPAPNDPQFADTLADGRVAVIWNSTDKKVNYSDGVNWYNADGTLA